MVVQKLYGRDIPLKIVRILFRFIAAATDDCSFELKNVVPTPVSLDDRLVVVCPPNHCSGEYVIEHLNHNTSQYEIIQQGSNRANVNIRELSDAGYFRCSKRCNDGRSHSPYCYLKAVGML